PERGARSQPAEGRCHRPDLRDRNKYGVAEKKSHQCRGGYPKDRDRGRAKTLMDDREAGGDRAGSGKGEKQPGRGEEVAVEQWEEAEHGHEENEVHGPARANAVLEGNGSSKTFAEEAFPRRDIGHRGNGKRVEESTHTESQGDGAHVILVPEIRVRFLRVL